MQPNNDNIPDAPGDLVDEALERLARSPAELAAWRAGAPERDAAAQEALALWRDLGETAAAADHRRKAAVRPPKSGALAWRWAAGIAAAVMLSVVLRHFAPPPPDYAAPAGERLEATLPDGSRAVLNVGAELTADFTGAERRVEVRRGEALFEVVADPARPFIVAAGGVSARAVGTAYAVRRLDDGAAVTVTQGVVEVRTGSGEFALLTAGRRAAAAVAGPIQVGAVDADTETAWRRGKLIFHSRPLSDVATEIERYLPGRVVVADDALRRLPVSGVFDLRHTDGLAQALADGAGLKALHLPWLTVIY